MIERQSVARRIFPLGTKGIDGPLARVGEAYAGYLPLVVLLGLVSSIMEGVGIGLLIPLVALLLADAIPSGIPAPIMEILRIADTQSVQSQIMIVGGVLIGLIICKGLVQAANLVLIDWINGAVGRDVRDALSRKILKLPYGNFIAQDPVRLVHIISTDSWFAAGTVKAILQSITAGVALGVFALLLIWLDWRLFLVLLVGAVLIRSIPLLLERRLGTLSSDLTRANQALSGRMLGIVSDMRTIRLFAQQGREQARFERAADKVFRSGFRLHRLSVAVAPAMETLLTLLFVLLLLASYWFGVGIPEVTAFLVLLSRAQPHARAISRARLEIASVRGSVLEVEWLLEAEEEEDRSLSLGRKPAPSGAPVRFDRVSYTYTGGNAALTDASFEIRPNVASALIGRSGSGKSTLVNLLCGLLEPASGEIIVGDVPLREIDRADWLDRVAIAGQDIELVEGTIAENIAYGRPDASADEISAAARVAGAHGFIEALPNGYATRTGQQGMLLSGGQRQRIGIARALLRRPELLVLDEATSAVDALSEQELLTLLRDHAHFRSVLVISHRRSTLANCEDGIVIEQGRIVEAGPLRDLEYYRRMAGEAA